MKIKNTKKEVLLAMFREILDEKLHQYMEYYTGGIAVHVPNKLNKGFPSKVGNFKIKRVQTTKEITSILYEYVLEFPKQEYDVKTLTSVMEVKQRHISELEKGHTQINNMYRYRIAEILGKSLLERNLINFGKIEDKTNGDYVLQGEIKVIQPPIKHK